jgi:DNA-directed RNA polymerase beta subunit
MPIHRYFLSDFVTIQRQSFFQLLDQGLIEEFSKRNPITNLNGNLEFYFYPEYYMLTQSEYNPKDAVLKNQSYTSKLFIPAQLTDRIKQIRILKWVYIGNIPLMTKRGHFILNGSARVIVNQILRSPGIYYQEKVVSFSPAGGRLKGAPSAAIRQQRVTAVSDGSAALSPPSGGKGGKGSLGGKGKRSVGPSVLREEGGLVALSPPSSLPFLSEAARYPEGVKGLGSGVTGLGQALAKANPERIKGNFPAELIETEEDIIISKKIYADLICMRGTWLRIEMDNEKKVWAQMKKNPKIPMYWFLLAMGLSEKKIFKTIINSSVLLNNTYNSIKTPPEAWHEIFSFLPQKKIKKNIVQNIAASNPLPLRGSRSGVKPPNNIKEEGRRLLRYKKQGLKSQNYSNEGRKWLYNRFMNPRSYDLGKQGRISFNKKLNLNISLTQTTLTGLDVLYATDYLMKVEKGIHTIDDIDHLKNRRVRTSGELIQIQIGIGLIRLEKHIRDLLNKTERSLKLAFAGQYLPLARSANPSSPLASLRGGLGVTESEAQPLRGSRSGVASNPEGVTLALSPPKPSSYPLPSPPLFLRGGEEGGLRATLRVGARGAMPSTEEGGLGAQPLLLPSRDGIPMSSISLITLVNSKAFNSAIREFFGSSPLSQFMDQINPLAELTHKRRLSSMGPGGVTRDTATLVIRGIHPTHYGRICPIETPEGKNTGLVNSMTTYARVNSKGILESPFYKVYKGQVQHKTGMYYFSAEQEQKMKLAASDISISFIGFLPKAEIPVRIASNFTKIPRSQVQYIGVSPLQMISIAASLIPFLEHDDANRALMGSNMQRQAVPLIRPEPPIVGTGLESKTISDSGHAILAKFSGLVTYVSAQKITVSSALPLPRRI